MPVIGRLDEQVGKVLIDVSGRRSRRRSPGDEDQAGSRRPDENAPDDERDGGARPEPGGGPRERRDDSALPIWLL